MGGDESTISANLEPIDREIDALGERFWSKMMRDFTCVGINGENLNMDRQLPAIDNLLKRDDTEHELYFYHGDHLGSSSYITDINGDATQHMQYLPFGEDFIHEQNATSYYTPYTFSAKERDMETQYSYFGARYYDAGLSIWLSVDPLASKYPHESPYAYCGNNPVMMIDPDGQEKLIWLNKNLKTDQTIIQGASKYQDDKAIHIFAHGSSKGFTAVINGEKIRVRNAKQFDRLLSKHSETWANRQEGDNTTVILHSCNTGRDNKDGTNSFAEQLSEAFKDVTFVAPDERVYTSTDGEKGTFKAKNADSNGAIKNGADGQPKSTERSSEPGSWRVFRGGSEVESYRGTWSPKNIATMIDKILYKENGTQ